ncbi:MAG: polysaccharide biosynthesis/export family protein [Candidatus Korobacteraceae bacterium]|jgi:polysaccharide export outer membrane protein
MYSQTRAFACRATLTLVLLVLLGAWAHTACGQNASSPASPDKPVIPASAAEPAKDVANAAQPGAANTLPPRVAQVRPDSYIIGSDDMLAINIWKEPEMSKTVPVRPDGMISLPLLGEIKAKGLTPVQLEDQISDSLKKIMSDPQVTVIVTSVNSLTFNVMGQVMKPGYLPITRPLTVLDAIALCGGFKDFAKQKKIYVLRTGPDGKQEQLKFNYKEVIKGRNMAQNIQLHPHDTLVVP